MLPVSATPALQGQLLGYLARSQVEAGATEVRWDGKDGSGTDVASGIYFCRLAAFGHEKTTKITVMR